ncbi:hypothetical protein FD19_GL001291 [Lacticaseibacillus thailandensis DSM 22698 = JCM 13996]|uniref:Uncharacterized protein n=1 Tax=Lacticaseibacillus thailandensis DSM 22698 = JCM 13996 TaxID=1423810 RepID=A0A0R2CHJ9_9LACO|nr:hypothetical protein FD19_GL001291 [Lacticaseibacillus thailandensis DSM 22698 = JCM 13996]
MSFTAIQVYLGQNLATAVTAGLPNPVPLFSRIIFIFHPSVCTKRTAAAVPDRMLVKRTAAAVRMAPMCCCSVAN